MFFDFRSWTFESSFKSQGVPICFVGKLLVKLTQIVCIAETMCYEKIRLESSIKAISTTATGLPVILFFWKPWASQSTFAPSDWQREVFQRPEGLRFHHAGPLPCWNKNNTRVNLPASGVVELVINGTQRWPNKDDQHIKEQGATTFVYLCFSWV